MQAAPALSSPADWETPCRRLVAFWRRQREHPRRFMMALRFFLPKTESARRRFLDELTAQAFTDYASPRRRIRAMQRILALEVDPEAFGAAIECMVGVLEECLLT